MIKVGKQEMNDYITEYSLVRKSLLWHVINAKVGIFPLTPSFITCFTTFIPWIPILFYFKKFKYNSILFEPRG